MAPVDPLHRLSSEVFISIFVLAGRGSHASSRPSYLADSWKIIPIYALFCDWIRTSTVQFVFNFESCSMHPRAFMYVTPTWLNILTLTLCHLAPRPYWMKHTIWNWLSSTIGIAKVYLAFLSENVSLTCWYSVESHFGHSNAAYLKSRTTRLVLEDIESSGDREKGNELPVAR